MQGGNALRKFVHKQVVRPKSSCWYYWYLEEIKKNNLVVCWVMLYTVPPNSKMFPIGGESVTCHQSKLIKSSDALSKSLIVSVHYFSWKAAFFLPVN